MTALRPAVIDVNVLFSATIRDLLIRCHIAGIIRIHWTTHILDETFIAIERARPGLKLAQLQRTRDLMNKGARGADVTDLVDEELVINETLAPDLKDLHVVRAAAAIGADIVTWNLDDFPSRLLQPHGIVAMSPDQYLAECVAFDSPAIRRVVALQAADLRNPPTSPEALVLRFSNQGLSKFTELLNRSEQE